MVVTNSTTLQRQATQPQALQMPLLQQSTHSFLREAAAADLLSAQAVAQEVFFQPRAHSQALTRSRSVWVEQLDQLDKITVEMVATLCSTLLQR